jgi:preprotein translocase subunit SecD
MLDRRLNLFLFAIAILFVGSVIVVWPQNPSSYLPGNLPLPGSEGVHLDFMNFHRTNFVLGLDLQGGSHLVLRADTSKVPQGEDPNAAVDGVTQVISKRINGLGVAEPIVQRRGTDRVIIELPGVKNIEDAKNLIGKTAQMDFREQKTVEGQQQWVTISGPNSDGVEKQLTGSFFKKAEVSFDQAGKPQILFEFNSEGAKLFGDATTRLKGKQIGIFLDDQPITTPVVQEPITQGRGVINGSFTLDDARNLVIQLNAGALPLPVTVEEERTVDATLGADSVHKSIMAGEIALLVVALFMFLYYRMLGVVAVMALVLYTLMVLSFFKLLPVTLTLAGIAGFILSIGMAVDANILIFERMKEELRTGKTVGAAIDAGFARAWPSIRDSNFSTLITCGILYWFGSNLGAAIVAGFALTLAIGVGLSMFSAIVVTRAFLRVVIGRRGVLNPSLFGMPTVRPRFEAAGVQG